MQTFAQKQKQSQKRVSSNFAQSNMATSRLNHRAGLIPHLQRTTGNQAVQQIMHANAEQLKAGSTGPASPCFGHDFRRIPTHPFAARAIQTKLAINKLGDENEQEADRISEQVMRMPEPQLQRTCHYGGECPECQTQQPCQTYESLQAKRLKASELEQTPVPPIVREVLLSPGQSLDPATRAFMEPRFGHDFGRVRVFTDAKAAESARAVNARAYTAGRDIVFGAGQYRPEEREGRRLLAHELAHVCQQSAQPTPSVQRQGVPPNTGASRSDAVVQQHIEAAFAANGVFRIEPAFRDLQSRRCLSQNCGDENLAAAEHYMFARYMVQDENVPYESMFVAIHAYALAKLAGFAPALCDCPATPTSIFQIGWAIQGAQDGDPLRETRQDVPVSHPYP